ncbi:hypothetical protein ACU5JM_31675 [Rhodococcus erythropolis]|uniref:hypothetical protein n=1 Tax=Rhodococcus erythropolis TaxID=1833 RepID=UPI00406BD821
MTATWNDPEFGEVCKLDVTESYRRQRGRKQARKQARQQKREMDEMTNEKNYSALKGIDLFRWKVSRLTQMAIETLPFDEQQAIADNPGVSYTVKDHVVEFRAAAFPDRILVQADADWILDDCDPSGPELEYVPSADEIPDTIAELTD